MIPCVVDCSFSSALFLPDERSDSVRDFFLNIRKGRTIHVPLLWWYETVNVLSTAHRRKRITSSDAGNVLQLIHQIPLETDAEGGMEITKRIFDLSQSYSLSAYDAVYCELALRKKAVLKTLDRELIAAAGKIGLSVE